MVGYPLEIFTFLADCHLTTCIHVTGCRPVRPAPNRPAAAVCPAVPVLLRPASLQHPLPHADLVLLQQHRQHSHPRAGAVWLSSGQLPRGRHTRLKY